MPATQVIMLFGLLVNLAAMLIGGLSLLFVVVKFFTRQERRLATVETEVRLIREHLDLKHAAPGAPPNGAGGNCVAGARH